MPLRSPAITVLFAGPDAVEGRPTPGPGRQRTRRGGLLWIAAALVCASLGTFSATAAGKGSVYAAAPAYPNSSLAIKAAGKPRAGKVVKVVVSGSNAPFEIGGPSLRSCRTR